MKYLGKLILEGVILVVLAALAVFAIIYFFGDKIIAMLGG